MPRKTWLTVLVVCLAVVGLAGAGVALRSAGSEMTKAAREFLASLSDQQRETATMDISAAERVDWHFIPKESRKGLQIRDMDEAQRKAAHRLLAAALSEIGYEKATEIMSLEEILRELEGPDARFHRDPERYYFTVFGDPEADARWGLSVEGHHLSLNFVVNDGRVVAHTPAFFGANPAIVKSDLDVGPKKGTRTLADEEVLAFELLASFSPEQRKLAVIAEEAPRDLRAAGEPQPPKEPAEGLAVDKMQASQVKALRNLLTAYTEKMPTEVAAETWSEIEAAGFDKVHFAWAGADRPGIGHYYRVQGPTFLVEFCNTQPDSAGNLANHIHSVWRDMHGDFDIQLDNHLDEDHFVSLFDGKSLEGWEGGHGEFRVEDGGIVGGSLERRIPRNEFLAYEHEYGDFELRLKFKLLGKGANAGVQIRSRRVPDHHEMSGYQADLGDLWWGCLYDESRRNRVLARPNGQELAKVLKRDDWNDYVIRCEGPRIQLWINGYQTVDYTEEENGIEQRGLVALQIHGGPPSEAWYKDIRIRKL